MHRYVVARDPYAWQWAVCDVRERDSRGVVALYRERWAAALHAAVLNLGNVVVEVFRALVGARE